MRMQSHRRDNQRLALAAIALCWTACIEEAERHQGPVAGEQATADDVAVIQQALGGFTELWSGEAAEVPVHIGPEYTVFRTSITCNQPVLLRTRTGARITTTALPNCPNVTAAASDGGVFVADSANRTIWEYGPQLVGGSGPGEGDYMRWAVATTPGNDIKKVLLNSTHIYWQDSAGIHRVGRGGGTSQLLASSGSLLGIDGSVLYTQTVSGGNFSLNSVPVTGGTQTSLRVHTMSFAPGFSFDANHFYWTEGTGVSGTLHRVRRLTKSGATLSTHTSSTTAMYQLPRTDGSFLWFRQQTISTGAAVIRRSNLSNGNNVTANFPMAYLDEMHVMPDWIYVAGRVSTSEKRWTLLRTSR
jgi:hypothetical protein